MMRFRKRTVEQPFGTLKQWMGARHHLTRKLAGVSMAMSLNVLAYNMKRVMRIIGANGLMKALSVLKGWFWPIPEAVKTALCVPGRDRCDWEQWPCDRSANERQ